MRPYLRALAVIALAATIGVIVDPVHRATTVRVALLALVVLGAVALVQFAARRLPPPEPSPFDPTRPAVVVPIVPVDLARAAADLELYRSPTGARLGSGAVDRLVRDVVRQRLALHHGVVVGDDPLADPDAAALLGPATAATLARRRAGQPAPIEPRLLAEELERL